MHCGKYHMQFSANHMVIPCIEKRMNTSVHVCVRLCYYVCDCLTFVSFSNVKVKRYDFALHVTLNLAHLRFLQSHATLN